MQDICDLIDNSDYLEYISLNYNKILAKGGKKLALSLEGNESVISFDISFNSIGQGGIITNDKLKKLEIQA